jgi:hypothetical protein
MAEMWEPSFPDIARASNPNSNREWELAETTNDSGDVPWVNAPNDSHVEAFRLYDSDDRQLRSFINRFMNGESQIQIRFKATKTRGVTQYTYFFADAAEAREVFEDLQTSPNPGEVVHQRLINKSIPYKRTV